MAVNAFFFFRASLPLGTFRWRQYPKVLRITASRIPAQMIDEKTFRDRTNKKFVS